ncbi:MAG: hypothetical protein AAGU05_15695, partial [Anaerolineaceae bacterium]
ISQKLAQESDPVIRQMKLARSGISLVDVDTMDTLGGRPSPAMQKQELSVGRGYLLRAGKLVSIVQIAFPDSSFYETIRQKYSITAKASWPHPASIETIDRVIIQQTTSAPPAVVEDFFDVSTQDLVETYRKLRMEENRKK